MTRHETSRATRALEILKQHPTGIRSAELARALGVETKQVHGSIASLVRNGDVISCKVTLGDGTETVEFRLAADSGMPAPPNPQAFSLKRRAAGNPIIPRPSEVGPALGSERPTAPAAPAGPPPEASRKPAPARPEAKPPRPGGEALDLQLDQDGGLIVSNDETTLALNPAQVLALGDFLRMTEGVWRP